jgi:pimeloyl-ACP methyl ester carboxylesterase
MDIAALETHRHQAITASGTVSYLDVGQGRPTVFIHGIITNSLLWRHVISRVASEHRRCIALDLPGHGHTPPADADADISLTGLAQRVIELCDHLGLDHFDLVANDTGIAVAQIVAAQLSDRVTTFTLTNGDTEGNTPPTLFKPVSIAARTGLLARLGPRIVASRRLKLSG